MDPVNPTAPPGSTPVFRGAEADAQVIRNKLNDLFNLAPEGSVIQNPERRAKLATSAEHVVELTAQLAIVQRAIPGLAGRLFGKAISGLEKDPGTGKVGATAGTTGNFLPSPLGFLDPTTVGLKRNFYLPPGTTDLVPRGVDIVGFGLPEQRVEDQARNSELAFNAAGSRLQAAQAAVQGESETTLNDILAGRGGLTRAGVVIATSGVDLPALQNAAQIELNQRGTGTFLDLPAGIVRAIPAAVASTNDPTAVPGAAPGAADGAPAPQERTPVNGAAIRQEETAQGLARELVHERLDP